MKKLLAKFIERGWIEPSDSEGASQAFIVPKKEKGEWRLVVGYRGLNEQTEYDSYSLPLIDKILQKQQKKRIFTVLDLKHGYHQMPLHPDSRPCTYDFSSCFFPKFKKSAKGRLSRAMTYYFGFYGPKIGGGGFLLPGFCPKKSKNLKFGPFWGIFACSGLVLQNSAAHQCTCL